MTTRRLRDARRHRRSAQELALAAADRDDVFRRDTALDQAGPDDLGTLSATTGR
jgi:hypothetical protein